MNQAICKEKYLSIHSNTNSLTQIKDLLENFFFYFFSITFTSFQYLQRLGYWIDINFRKIFCIIVL